MHLLHIMYLFGHLPSAYTLLYTHSLTHSHTLTHIHTHTHTHTHTRIHTYTNTLSLSLYYTLLYRLIEKSSWRPRKGECLWLALYIAHPLGSTLPSLSLFPTHTHTHNLSLSILVYLPMFFKNVCFCAYGLSSSVYTAREGTSKDEIFQFIISLDLIKIRK